MRTKNCNYKKEKNLVTTIYRLGKEYLFYENGCLYERLENGDLKLLDEDDEIRKEVISHFEFEDIS